MNPRRRKRASLRDLHAYVKPDTYLYISDLCGADTSLGVAIDQLVKEHKMLRNAPASLPLVDKTGAIN